jgi:ubiquinone/menaquinone biosynthesis C-methylase UbiE
MLYKDNFSTQAQQYALFRPHYPQSLYDYLLVLVGKERGLLWDCATGNGQVAHHLATHFQQVIATDASEAQIENAFSAPNIQYRVGKAHESGLPNHSTDLITVGQALHWFAQEDFYAEVQRVGKPQSYFVAWGYALCKIEPAIDVIVKELYTTVLGNYWDKERHYLDDFYKTLPFPFDELAFPTFEMTSQYDLLAFKQYLATWSSWQKYQKAHAKSPLEHLEQDLDKAWGNPTEIKTIHFPLCIKATRI